MLLDEPERALDTEGRAWLTELVDKAKAAGAALLAAVAIVHGALDVGSLGLPLYEGVVVSMGLARGPDLLLIGLIATSIQPG